MTGYNRRIYRIERIDFELNPKISFNLRDKAGNDTSVTLMEYY